jgi:hypothetical protein
VRDLCTPHIKISPVDPSTEVEEVDLTTASEDVFKAFVKSEKCKVGASSVTYTDIYTRCDAVTAARCGSRV